ncbi:DUF2218 domain-containing protein [Nocardia sp. NPDC004278]
MPIIEARIPTDRPHRYLRQFTKHASTMGSPRAHRIRKHSDPVTHAEIALSIESTDIRTTIVFDPWGRCVLSDDANTLNVRIEATDDRALQRIREIITRDLDRFGRHELTVQWQSIDEPDSAGAAP